MPNPVVFFEIGCKDRSTTAEFYSKLFDWGLNDTGMSTYIQTQVEQGIQGHIAAMGHEPHNYVTVYVEVDDIDAYLTKVVSLGGKKIVGPIPLPNGKKFAWFSDIEGTVIGLYS
jgi:predicted enzyme related to lactoylglutathione lyase